MVSTISTADCCADSGRLRNAVSKRAPGLYVQTRRSVVSSRQSSDGSRCSSVTNSQPPACSLVAPCGRPHRRLQCNRYFNHTTLNVCNQAPVDPAAGLERTQDHVLFDRRASQQVIPDRGCQCAVKRRRASSTRVGFGLTFKYPVVAITNPGMQNAHWNAWLSTTACCTGCSVPSAAANPSTVVIAFVRTVCVSTEQE